MKIYGFFGTSAYSAFLRRLSLEHGRPAEAIALRKARPRFIYHKGHLVYKQERFKLHILFSDGGPDIFINPPADFPLYLLTGSMGWASQEYAVKNLLADKQYFVNRQSCTCPAAKPCKHQSMIRPELDVRLATLSFSDSWERIRSQKAPAPVPTAPAAPVPASPAVPAPASPTAPVPRISPFPVPTFYPGDIFRVFPHSPLPGETKSSTYSVIQFRRSDRWHKPAQAFLLLGETDRTGVAAFAAEAARRGASVSARSREGVTFHYRDGKWLQS